MQPAARKYLTLFLVLAATAAAGVLGLRYLEELRGESVYRAHIATIKTASGIEEIEDFHARIDTLRGFINANSQHKEDAEFFANWRDKTKMAEIFIDQLEGRRTDLPHMECSTRSALMAAVLQSEGYKTRSIDAYGAAPGDTELSSHALLDVWNPHAKAWETQDPEYDVYWKNGKTGTRVSMIAVGADDAIVPCNAKTCGWDVESREGNKGENLKILTGYLTAIDRARNERVTYHRPGIAPDAVLRYDGRQGTYCTLLAKNCQDGFLPATSDNLQKVMD